jgi:predicted metal-dependent HD superfamily phosphohydrolase
MHPTHRSPPTHSQVRLEYCHVLRAVYLQARANVLRKFLRADNLYFTAHARSAGMEERARRNLREEIRRLEASGRAA